MKDAVDIATDTMTTIETPRIQLRRLRESDAAFIVELLNDPGFLRYIGDRRVRTLQDARNYIANGPMRSYENYGYGLLLMESKQNGASMGLCGLVQRDYLPDPDLGFAALPQYRNTGMVFEAAAAVLKFAREVLKMKRISAIVQPANLASLKLLDKLGFTLDRPFKRSAVDPEILVLAYSRLV